jgi:poly(U)-binding-splicing factor PUF60
MQAAKQNDEATLASQEHIEIRGNDARHMLMHKLMRTNRSTVMVLKNMVDFDGVDDELEEEIRSECKNFGTVTDLVIVKEKSLEEVRIFVRFADPTQTESAVNVFDGRYFDGRTVKAQIYDQTLYDFEDFTG